jgi:hypothetical protein
VHTNPTFAPMPYPIIIDCELPHSLLTPTGIVGRNERGDRLYSTHCSCGGPKADSRIATAKELRHNIRSCGCLRFGAVAQMKKGELTLICPTEKRSHSNVVYAFQCSCNNTREMTLGAFKQAVYPTCGRQECKAKRITKARLPHEEAAWNRLYARYFSAAQAAGREFSLTRDDCIRLFRSPCMYCGRKPSKWTKNPGANGQVCWNGIDRYYNSLGYTIENSVPCCDVCNLAKGPMDGDQFLAHIRRLAVHMKLLEYPTDEDVESDLSVVADMRVLQTTIGGSSARAGIG